MMGIRIGHLQQEGFSTVLSLCIALQKVQRPIGQIGCRIEFFGHRTLAIQLSQDSRPQCPDGLKYAGVLYSNPVLIVTAAAISVPHHELDRVETIIWARKILHHLFMRGGVHPTTHVLRRSDVLLELAVPEAEMHFPDALRHVALLSQDAGEGGNVGG